MSPTISSNSGLKQILRIIFFICIALTIIVLLAAFLFFKDHTLTERIEQILNSRLEGTVELGSITLTDWQGVIFNDVVIRKKDNRDPVFVIPYLKIGFNVLQLVTGTIDSVDLKKPRFYFEITEQKDPGIQQEIPTLPFSLNRVSIEDGRVIFMRVNGKPFIASAINLSMKKIGNTRTEIRGEIFLDNDGITVPVEAVLNILPPEERGSSLLTAEADFIFEDVGFINAATGFPGFPAAAGYTVQGKGEVHAALTVIPSEGPGYLIQGSTDVRISKGGFSSPDFSRVAEGITLTVSTGFSYDVTNRLSEFSMIAHAADFELLWGSFYGSFKDRDIALALEGKYTGESDSLNIARSEIDISGIGKAYVSGHIDRIKGSPRFTADINVGELSNKNIFDFFIKETFQDRFALLSRIETSGFTWLRFAAEGTADHVKASGEFQVKDMDIIDRGSSLAVKGITIVLPVDVSYPGQPYSGKIGRFGEIRIADIRSDVLHIKDLHLFPAVVKNALVFKEDIVIPVFGGSVRLKDITYSDLLSPERELTSSISIESVDLEEVSSTLHLPGFSGNVSGIIPDARFYKGSLSADGQISMKFFDGEMIFDNMTIRNIFSPVPSLETSVEIRDINLSRLTDTFDFGHISGLLQGQVRDLVITEGQAERFEAFIETVERKGINQLISVEALKKISILGSGTPASVLSSGIYQFFKEYRYKKMGFRGTLKNDNFLLLGIEAEGNREYIVRGGLLPPKVDVISYTQNVSFQEMLKRLKRVKQLDKGEEKDTMIRPGG
jgi:hypothetical protein